MTVQETRLPDTASSPTAPVLELKGVSVRLGDRLALRHISLEVTRGSFVGLIGPNGSGKSTLIRASLGIVPLAEGRVLVDGRPPQEARDSFAYLPQRQQIELELPLRVYDVVLMGRLRHRGWLRGPAATDRDLADWAIERVGLSDRRNSTIGEMSFGQQQRVFLARALVQQGSLILMDEPMNGVDSKTQGLFLELLESFHAEGRTVIMATHDLNQAADICDQICLLNNRMIAYGPPSEVLTAQTLHEAYGAHIHFLETDASPHAEMLEDVHHHPTDPRWHRHD